MTDKDKLKALEAELSKLSEIKDRYYIVLNEASKLREKVNLAERHNNVHRLSLKCNYIEPVYPDMGVTGENGSALFINKEDAELLVKYLLQASSYYNSYKLEWSEPGEYAVIPSYRRDHDNEVIYTATFVKI